MTFPSPSRVTAMAAMLSLALIPISRALEIRNYKPRANDWLVWTGDEAALNPAFKPSAARFSGVGFPDQPDAWERHVTLVSPLHFVCATHHPPEVGWRIEFIAADGTPFFGTVASVAAVPNADGQPTDLMLGTFAEEINPAIEPFPVLVLKTEARYRGRPMLVFGQAGEAAKTNLQGFTTLENDPGFDTTRFAFFDFGKRSACTYESGDSGCPVFMLSNGEPALIGTASGQDLLGDGSLRNYCNFIPAYLSSLDAMMAPDGYLMRRVPER
ncbi:hypothetical protein [Luteolibacter soli]|uniref:Peptidase S1 domain-containing protein n=1 Tax=Luteolibacter soli TaxID=3135280 RepID=A0ABU9B135_9BACT